MPKWRPSFKLFSYSADLGTQKKIEGHRNGSMVNRDLLVLYRLEILCWTFANVYSILQVQRLIMNCKRNCCKLVVMYGNLLAVSVTAFLIEMNFVVMPCSSCLTVSCSFLSMFFTETVIKICLMFSLGGIHTN